MNHTHPMSDPDAIFTIDPTTRVISTNVKKIVLMQYDHNSEIFTFSIPRFVEGHDMSLCNKIEIHYTNINKRTREQSKDVYPVTDKKVESDNLAFTWLLSGNATKYPGSLNFIIRFKCVEDDGSISYMWNTDIFKNVTVSDGISNTETVIEDYSDILEQWKSELINEIPQSDYEQNDSTAKDYIKNRPFYTEVTETTLLDGTFDFVENNGLYMTISKDFPVFLEEGKTYTIIFDGTSYSCVGYIPVEGFPIFLGNISLSEPELTGGNNEPFVMANASDVDSSLGIATNLTDSSHTVKIIAPVETIKKLDEKYLPDEIYTAIDTVDSKVATAIDTVDSKVATAIDTVDSKVATKMDKENPTGTGSFSLNRKANTAIGDYSFAEGYHTTAFGKCSHAEGESTIAGQMGFGVTACEKLTDTTGTYTLTSVAGLTRYERYSVSLSSSKKNCGKITSIDTANKKITVDGYPDIALNSSSSPTANYLTIVNKPGLGDISVSGSCSHAEGISTTASGQFSHAEGNYATASGYCSHAEGSSTTASGSQSHAEGDGTKASGDYSHAEGRQTTASGQFSHAEGCYTTVSGRYSHTEGFYATASGEISHAEGSLTTASGGVSHAEGESTNRFSSVVTATNPTDADIIIAWESKNFSLSKGNSSHVEGKDSLALGNYSHAEGHLTTASGTSSHAEGFRTAASGDDSHAEGDGTTAEGDYSHAEGYMTTASGDDSHAEGANTKASSEDQHAQGKYNIEDSTGTYADIIGNGTSDTARSNAATVDWSGNAWYAGDVYVGSTSGTNKDAGSKKLATEEYVDSKQSGTAATSLGITGAAVGQIGRITAVDSDGKPTAWEPVDMDGGEKWELLNSIMISENVNSVELTVDSDGNSLSLKKAIIICVIKMDTENPFPYITAKVNDINVMANYKNSSTTATTQYFYTSFELIPGWGITTEGHISYANYGWGFSRQKTTGYKNRDDYKLQAMTSFKILSSDTSTNVCASGSTITIFGVRA